MKLHYPQFVFEIRYNHILNFKDVYRDILSQFLKLSERFTIGKQNIVEENIILHFPSENYSIITQWDRIVFQYEGEFSKLCRPNSIMEMPFFSMFKEIQSIESYSGVQHTILQTAVVNSDIESGDPLSNIKSKYLTENLDNLLSDFNDVALTMEKHEGKRDINITYGPYKGIQDLTKRDIRPENPENIPESNIGEMAIVKIIEQGPNVDFKSFVQQCKFVEQKIKSIWAI